MNLTEKRPAYAFYDEGDPEYDEVLDAHYSWHDDDEEETPKKEKSQEELDKEKEDKEKRQEQIKKNTYAVQEIISDYGHNEQNVDFSNSWGLYKGRVFVYPIKDRNFRFEIDVCEDRFDWEIAYKENDNWFTYSRSGWTDLKEFDDSYYENAEGAVELLNYLKHPIKGAIKHPLRKFMDWLNDSVEVENAKNLLKENGYIVEWSLDGANEEMRLEKFGEYLYEVRELLVRKGFSRGKQADNYDELHDIAHRCCRLGYSIEDCAKEIILTIK